MSDTSSRRWLFSGGAARLRRAKPRRQWLKWEVFLGPNKRVGGMGSDKRVHITDVSLINLPLELHAHLYSEGANAIP